MLTRVDVQSENPFYLNIRDSRPTDSIIVEKIEGLGPPDVDLFMGDYARDGGFYSGRRVPPRSVTITLKLNPDYSRGESVSGLRTMLYKAFLDPFISSDSPSLILKDDELPDRYLIGYTEKFEADLFSTETIVQISMLCPNPYIWDNAQTIRTATGPSIPFTYGGSAETGFELRATITIPTTSLNFSLNGSAEGTLGLAYGAGFQEGDKIYVDTRPGSRRITLTRGSVTTNILYAKLSYSKWLELHAKDNVINAYGASTTSIVATINEIRFRAAHWGV